MSGETLTCTLQRLYVSVALKHLYRLDVRLTYRARLHLVCLDVIVTSVQHQVAVTIISSSRLIVESHPRTSSQVLYPASQRPSSHRCLRRWLLPSSCLEFTSAELKHSTLKTTPSPGTFVFRLIIMSVIGGWQLLGEMLHRRASILNTYNDGYWLFNAYIENSSL